MVPLSDKSLSDREMSDREIYPEIYLEMCSGFCVGCMGRHFLSHCKTQAGGRIASPRFRPCALGR